MNQISFVRSLVLWSLPLVLVTGCASLQIDVDVYKGPLANEKEIQVQQFATMATSAKPLIVNLYCKSAGETTEQSCAEKLRLTCDQIPEYKQRFLCEVLYLYEDKPGLEGGNSSQPVKSYTRRSQSRKPGLGLDSLTAAVTKARETGNKKAINEAVEALTEALVFFSQKVLYMTNNELLFGSPAEKDKDPMVAVLQSLGNTILVHANDLQRQKNRKAEIESHAASEGNAVQQAFDSEPAVILVEIKNRLRHHRFGSGDPDEEETQDTVRDDELRAKTVAIVEVVSRDVLTSAEKIKTRDPRVIRDLLLQKLEELGKNTGKNKFTAADVKVTLSTVEKFRVFGAICQGDRELRTCRSKNTVEVVDNLIARLRAQRVQAIAVGDAVSAANLLNAINAAYDQRTAMIYLRPASDYLRSVYSANELQEGTEDQYRNMLAEWFKHYLNPFEKDGSNARRELEKIHWQNVNKVTVSGGGSTNYVLAKDDVGNWYVKAYGSDPEAIIKSATSLALFNSGKAVNMNLLRRFDVQRQLDEDKNLSSQRRAELQQELASTNKAGGQSLLKVRDRYADRYRRDTDAQANSLLAQANDLPGKVAAEIAQVPDWPEDKCPVADTKALLAPLDAKYLVSARDRLSKALADESDPAKASFKTLEQVENGIQGLLTGMHVYSSDAQRVLGQVKDSACPDVQRTAGDRVRSYVRAQVAAAATDRKASIERYEDALTHILEVAGEK
ncbi:hypothetical protein SAMN05518865_102354 [Duganella sp. CF458]|uniref:hypothetical protein n=1 Tax=Duganella sp. CF458 TaxID=1884368 RepID=UPI0008E1BFE1|nr:hypothetical protein [Duganella sp. CF458]SFF63601.1 hypothetical protein SAMN05518865_102354 [Duganella sp. CF458]